MFDIECPYCGKELDIDHDGGYGYAEDQIHRQECLHCEKYFVYTTQVSFNYNAKRAECLNDGNHKFEKINSFSLEFSRYKCADCGEQKPSRGLPER